uniref:Uncharacterized protein n=1 Tax=Brassica oleracea var. oleracea TaxID=109376 RepID=A0A0D2ZS53_BRAOL
MQGYPPLSGVQSHSGPSVDLDEKSFTLLVKFNDYYTESDKDYCDEFEKERKSASQESDEEEELNSGNGNDNKENPFESEEDPEEPQGNSNKKQD